MAGRRVKELGPLGLALAAWDVWRRLPPRQRQLVVDQARKHGPRLVKQALNARRPPR